MKETIITISGGMKSFDIKKDLVTLMFHNTIKTDISIEEIGTDVCSNDTRYNAKNLKFFTRPLNSSELTHYLLLFPKTNFPEEFFNSLPKFGEEVIIIDFISGKKVYTHIDNKQYMIAGLSSIWKHYPQMKCGDIVKVAIDPEDHHIIYVDLISGKKTTLHLIEKDDVIFGKREVINSGASVTMTKKIKWFGKELLPADVNYNIIGFNTNICPKEFIDSLPRFGTEFRIVDIRTGKKYDAYMNIKQYQISKLKKLYDQYPNIKVGDIIGIAINPENKKEVLVNFEYGKVKKEIIIQKQLDEETKMPGSIKVIDSDNITTIFDKKRDDIQAGI